MKLVCSCGNEMEFVVDNTGLTEPDEYEELIDPEDRGNYVKKDYSKFNFWAQHEEAGFKCKNCDKAIWYFT